jgi:ABC-type phosphate/phosphonate transport system permease subunit
MLSATFKILNFNLLLVFLTIKIVAITLNSANFFMRSLIFQNLKLTIPTALVFTILGYILSLPLSFLGNSEAVRWQLNPQGRIYIETRKLDELGSFQARVALGGTALGILVAQTTFIAYMFGLSNRSPKQ